ncbi:MAG: hypothetical protein ACPL1K_01340 [Candidatus Kryptoniota bacterium]
MIGLRIIILAYVALFAIFFMFFPSINGYADTIDMPGDENWDATIGNPGSNNFVGGITFINNQIIAGGGFNQIGSKTASIGSWNSGDWGTINGKSDGTIYSLVYDNIHQIVYAGGTFTYIEGCSENCKNIAQWDGNEWSSLDGGVNDSIFAMILDQNGNLYAGGSFTQAGSNAASHIAKWDGYNWSAIGDGVPNDVFALAFDSNGTLYTGDNKGNLMYWNSKNSSWGTFITVGGGIFALAFDSFDHFYIGGSFNDYGNNIVMWDGFYWNYLDSGLIDVVNALSVDSCDGIYVGTNLGSGFSPITYWDGTSWQDLGSGISNNSGGYVQTMKFQNGLLAIGGSFDTSGMNITNNVALWTGADCAKVNDSDVYTLYAYSLPITITLTSGNGNLSKIKIQRYNTDHPNATDLLKTGYHWKIEAINSLGQPADGYSLNLTMTAPFEPDQNDKLCHFDEVNSSWNCAVSSFDAQNHTLTLNGVSSLSDWAIGDDAGPTSIQLVNFHADDWSRVSPFMSGVVLLGIFLFGLVRFLHFHKNND